MGNKQFTTETNDEIKQIKRENRDIIIKLIHRTLLFLFYQGVVFSAYLAFQNIINEKWAKFIVAPLFEWTDSIGLRVLVVLLCLGACYYFRRLLLFSSSVSLSVFSSVYILLVFNLYNGYWTFFPMGNSGLFTYYGLFIVLLTISLLCTIKVKLSKQYSLISKKRLLEKSDRLQLDSPIENIEDDLLGRAELINSIKKIILNTDVSKSAAVIGISGEWGSGKTSVLKLLYKELLNYRFIQFKFSPWQYNMNSDYSDLFLLQLEKELAAHNYALNTLSRYRNILEQSGDNRFRLVLAICDFLFPTTIEATMEKVKDKMKDLPFKIVVHIDDLDRLQKNEILSILRLIKNQSDFPNLIFVVAYDQHYVLKQLGDLGGSLNSSYLDKIFFPVINLPPQKEKNIASSLGQILNSSFKNNLNDLKELSDIIENVGLSYSSKPVFIDTLRNAKRIVSIFRSKYDQLKGEVNAVDLYYLCVIEARWPLFYNLLVQRESSWFNIDRHSYRTFISLWKEKKGKKMNFSEKPTFEKYVIDSVDAEGKINLISYIKENHSTYLISEKATDTVIAILKLLFPGDNKTKDRKQTINKPYYFDSYFDVKPPLISSDEFKRISLCKDKQLINVNELLNFSEAKQRAFEFLLYEYRNDMDKEKYIILKMNALCCFRQHENIFDNEEVISDIKKYLNNKEISTDQTTDILKGCIPSVPVLLTIKYLLQVDSFSKKELKEIYLLKLKSYLNRLNSNKVLKDKAFIIMHIIASFAELDDHDEPIKTFIDGALPLVKEFSSHRVEEHIRLFYNNESNFGVHNRFKINSYSSFLWGDEKAVNNFLQELDDEGKPELVKLKEFSKAYIDGNCTPIPFDFV